MKQKILLVDDEESIRFTFNEFLVRIGYEVTLAADYDEAMGALDSDNFDLVFLDILLGNHSGIEILSEVKKNHSGNVPVIMITGAPGIETAAEALRLGAYDYISKPVRLETIQRIAKVALEHKAVLDENQRHRANVDAIFRSINDAVISVDKDMNILEFNAAASVICGFGDSVKGSAIDGVDGECSGKCVSLLRRTLRDNAPHNLVRQECTYGDGRVVSATSSPLLDDNGESSGAILIIKDETRLASLEKALKDRKSFHSMVGKNSRMQDVYELVENLSDYDSTVLITGESGTGKELVAQSLHYSGSRIDKPFVRINCAALPESLLESELFGHVKGAFTGAIGDKKGKFEHADGGSIFLDEIGDISPHTQVRLLRVLQEKNFERVGGNVLVSADVRIITATNKNLEELVQEGIFREDLYYRLNVVNISLPALRDRADDIPLLVEHFIEKFNGHFRKHVTSISADALEFLMKHSWPGNIRQLGNILESAFVWIKGDTIELEHIPEGLRKLNGSNRSNAPGGSNGSGSGSEKERHEVALRNAGWNKAKAARTLGITRATLYKRITKFDIAEV